jgi:ADP-heptose:LPS heptosyltransferase
MRPHVLVARLDSLGDVLLAGPAIRAVAAGAGRVTLLCGPRGKAAAELLPGVDEVVVFHAPWIDPEPEPVTPDAMHGLVARIAALGVDQAAILTSFHQSPLPLALLLRLAGVPTITAVSDDYPGTLLDVRHRVPPGIHEVERALSVVGTLGYGLPPGDNGRLQVRRVAAGDPVPLDLEPPYVVVHPGASVPARAWSRRRYRDLVAALARARSVVITGGPDECSLTRYVAGERARVVDAGGRLTFPQLADVLAGAEVVVVANTGPAHLAAAVGTPVVSVFAPTVPASAWRPWGVPCRLLGVQDIGCAGCRARVCPLAAHPCIGQVTVAEVVRAVGELAQEAVDCVPARAGRQDDRLTLSSGVVG